MRRRRTSPHATTHHTGFEAVLASLLLYLWTFVVCEWWIISVSEPGLKAEQSLTAFPPYTGGAAVNRLIGMRFPAQSLAAAAHTGVKMDDIHDSRGFYSSIGSCVKFLAHLPKP